MTRARTSIKQEIPRNQTLSSVNARNNSKRAENDRFLSRTDTIRRVNCSVVFLLKERYTKYFSCINESFQRSRLDSWSPLNFIFHLVQLLYLLAYQSQNRRRNCSHYSFFNANLLTGTTLLSISRSFPQLPADVDRNSFRFDSLIFVCSTTGGTNLPRWVF